MFKLNKLRYRCRKLSHIKVLWSLKKKKQTSISLLVRQKKSSNRDQQSGQWGFQCLTAPSKQDSLTFPILTLKSVSLQWGLQSQHRKGRVWEGCWAEAALSALQYCIQSWSQRLLQELLWAMQTWTYKQLYATHTEEWNSNMVLCFKTLLLWGCYFVCVIVLGFLKSL